MSDLLNEVRAVNPVPACAPPSIEAVWHKLEHENASASSHLDAVGTGGPRAWAGVALRARSSRLRHGPLSRRGLTVATVFAAMIVAVVVVAVVRGGGVGPVAPARQAAIGPAVQRLAKGTISCEYATSHLGDRADVGPVATDGRPAIAFCRDRYEAGGGVDRSRVAFIVCQTSATNVTVYLADGRVNQCRRLGDRAVPAGYTAAVRRTRPHETAQRPTDQI